MPFDVIDFENVDPRFGTKEGLENEEFKDLVSAVHSKDMRIVMDLPISTTSVKHKWYKPFDIVIYSFSHCPNKIAIKKSLFTLC